MASLYWEEKDYERKIELIQEVEKKYSKYFFLTYDQDKRVGERFILTFVNCKFEQKCEIITMLMPIIKTLHF